MDLEYLLFLQNNIRNEALTPIMMWISDFAISFWMLSFVYITYWCINKKVGYLMICSTTLANALNGLVKLSFCTYRPWVRDQNIIPASVAKNTATGYSFPSGHTQGITGLLGSFAHYIWFKKRWIAILCIIFILLVGFSRNYLGVHTPQDVIVGLILGILSISASLKLQETSEKNDKKADIKLLIYSLLASAAALIYFKYKNYPIDKDIAGNIIVNPEIMMKDGFMAVGMWVGFCVGWFIEKYYINFSVDGSILNKIIRGIIGLVILNYLSIIIKPILIDNLSACWASFWRWFISIFYVVAVYPLLFKRLK